MFKIRNATPDDFDRIFEIWLDNQLESIGTSIESQNTAAFKRELFQTFSSPNAHFYVAVLDSDKMIGWQSLTPLFTNPALRPYIAQSSTYIDKGFFRTDVGQSLIQHAFGDAKKIGIDQIYGWVKPESTAIHKIVAKLKLHPYTIPGTGNVPEFTMYVLNVEELGEAVLRERTTT